MAAKRSKQAPLLAAFISHAKADEKKANAIAEGLESRGFKCWIAPRDVRAGRSYGDEIIRGIESTRSFVLVLSKASNDSAFVAREVERAVSKKKPIFAVRIANVEPAPSLELFISGTQWIDAFSGGVGAHIDRLAGLLAEEEGVEPAKPEAGKD
ncbi:MAG: toll/interleukin-1 receptor domain-containing protein, partial [Methyloceanibacter sp.]